MQAVHLGSVVRNDSTRSVMDQKELVEALLLKSMTQLRGRLFKYALLENSLTPEGSPCITLSREVSSVTCAKHFDQ